MAVGLLLIPVMLLLPGYLAGGSASSRLSHRLPPQVRNSACIAGIILIAAILLALSSAGAHSSSRRYTALKGSSTRAPVGSKCFKLRVTTVRLWHSAVAAIKLSMLLLPV